MSVDIEKAFAISRVLEKPDSEVPVPPEPVPTGQLHKKLKSRHVQLIAVGGSIGAGLFVGSGVSLEAFMTIALLDTDCG